MNSVDIHGVQLEVAHIPGPSDRPPMVFLHEGLGSVSLWTQRGVCWPAQLCEATGRAGWMYSRRGYGQSDPVAQVRGPARMEGFWHVGRHEPDYMHREALDVLPLVLAQLGIERPVLVGHSDGATIALLHAARFDVSACVAIAPHVFVEDMSVQAIAQAREAYIADPDSPTGLRQRLARHHRDVDNAFWQWNDVWLSEAFRTYDIVDECSRIRAPLLVVQGEQDEYGSLQQVESVRRAVPHSLAHTLPDCGHSPQRDQPHALTTLLQAFVNSVPN
ncbi:MAG: alpha/beta hydrolase [Hydrogenophaga sp.]|uniref:alpha/beta fold hydrolase n=1 Tax=Hydrogenophaga sp. TaxID=1904254 RepID=UPI001D6C6B47|nr:alpha/beta hydrolase [Hydrogenophaga sp.]MBX3610910.1 alpha/beta hydrolase [Hydrogenophaga sp.]